MTTICPHCQHIRQGHESAPAWECPACGIAYYKPVKRPGAAVPWGRYVMWIAAFAGLWLGAQFLRQHLGPWLATGAGSATTAWTPADIKALADRVRPEEVVMYSTSRCPYCAEAKSWLQQNGFGFDECNMDDDKRCEREFADFGGNGTPYLVVRGRHMKDGFDAREFLTLLALER